MSRKTLAFGSTGEDVGYLQDLLNLMGLPVKRDRIFGPETDTAVRRFQLAAGLPQDGIVGPNTWAALEATAATVTQAGPATSISPQTGAVAPALTPAPQQVIDARKAIYMATRTPGTSGALTAARPTGGTLTPSTGAPGGAVAAQSGAPKWLLWGGVAALAGIALVTYTKMQREKPKPVLSDSMRPLRLEDDEDDEGESGEDDEGAYDGLYDDSDGVEDVRA